MLARADTSVDAPAWWPDWRGRPCVIIASGPSSKQFDVSAFRGHFRVIAIKEAAFHLAPWAEVAYGCDLAWWKYRRGLDRFGGLKIGWDRRIASLFPDVRTIEIRLKARPDKYVDDLLFDRCGEIGCGGNSGFQAFNLALQFGVTKVALVGFDMHDRSGKHWYGRNTWARANNPDSENFRRWRSSFDRAAYVCRMRGIAVVTLSSISDLSCFRRQTTSRLLAEWMIR